MSFNSEIVVRIVQTVSGQQGSSIHVSSESGNALWTSKCDKVSFFSHKALDKLSWRIYLANFRKGVRIQTILIKFLN